MQRKTTMCLLERIINTLTTYPDTNYLFLNSMTFMVHREKTFSSWKKTPGF